MIAAPTRDILAAMTGGNLRAIRFLEDLAALAGPPQVWLDPVAASRALTPADFQSSTVLRVNSSGAVVLTVPAALGVAMPLTISRFGTGAVTFLAGSGVTILSAGGLLSISARYAAVTLTPLPNVDTYLLTGSLA